MAYIRAQVQIQGLSGLPEDKYLNTWHFDTGVGDLATDADATSITTALTSFYQAVDNFLSPNIQPTVWVKYYDLAESEPRIPFEEDQITLTVATLDGLPEEVALCMSFQAAPFSGTVQARRRGRIFLGPLNIAAASNAVDTTQVRPSNEVITAVVGAANAFQASGVGTWWAVYSPTLHAQTGSLATAMTNVTEGWVDNAFDVQRRRGARATARTEF